MPCNLGDFISSDSHTLFTNLNSRVRSNALVKIVLHIISGEFHQRFVFWDRWRLAKYIRNLLIQYVTKLLEAVSNEFTRMNDVRLCGRGAVIVRRDLLLLTIHFQPSYDFLVVLLFLIWLAPFLISLHQVIWIIDWQIGRIVFLFRRSILRFHPHCILWFSLPFLLNLCNKQDFMDSFLFVLHTSDMKPERHAKLRSWWGFGSSGKFSCFFTIRYVCP